MSFYSEIIDSIRNINTVSAPPPKYTFGTILSGSYVNYKHDPNPTFLCLGCYNKNGHWYIHGIQLHVPDGSRNFLLRTINDMRNRGVVSNPIIFYSFLKANCPSIITNCYRTYLSEYSNFKMVHPGLTNINEQFCYPIIDGRDEFLKTFNKPMQIKNVDINSVQMRENITQALNTVKVW